MGNDKPSTCTHSLIHSSFLYLHSSCGGINQVIAGWLVTAGAAFAARVREVPMLLDEDDEEDEEEEEALDGSEASEEADR